MITQIYTKHLWTMISSLAPSLIPCFCKTQWTKHATQKALPNGFIACDPTNNDSSVMQVTIRGTSSYSSPPAYECTSCSNSIGELSLLLLPFRSPQVRVWVLTGMRLLPIFFSHVVTTVHAWTGSSWDPVFCLTFICNRCPEHEISHDRQEQVSAKHVNKALFHLRIRRCHQVCSDARVLWLAIRQVVIRLLSPCGKVVIFMTCPGT